MRLMMVTLVMLVSSIVYAEKTSFDAIRFEKFLHSIHAVRKDEKRLAVDLASRLEIKLKAAHQNVVDLKEGLEMVYQAPDTTREQQKFIRRILITIQDQKVDYPLPLNTQAKL